MEWDLRPARRRILNGNVSFTSPEENTSYRSWT